MNDYAIVVLSGYADILTEFMRPIMRFDVDTKLILVTSGELSSLKIWTVAECIHGPEPFSFPRNANIGIRAAGRADVFLVNDDVQFLEAGSVGKLARIAHEHPEVGVLSPQFEGRVGNRMQERSSLTRHPDDYRFEDGVRRVWYTETRLCFTGVYIRREVLDLIGELDEQFDGYGRDDDDYCRRVRNAGLKLAVTPEVVMRHGFGEEQHSASFKRAGYPRSGIDPRMTQLYAQKWGDTK